MADTETEELYDNHGNIDLEGSSNAYTATVARSVSGYYKGLRLCGKANHSNSGAATLELITKNAPGGLGAVAIRKSGTAALVAGDIISGQYYDFVYDEATGFFQVLSPAPPTIAAGSIGTTELADGAVTSTKLADEAVTNAKLAHAAAWTIKMRNAGTTGDPSDAALADITEDVAPAPGDFVLGFLDSGEIRKFDVDNLSGDGGLDFLTSGTLSSAASLSVVLTAYTAYRAIKFVFTEWIPQTDNVNLYCRTSTNGGSSYDSGGSDYAWAEFFLNATSGGSTGDGGDNLDSEIELGGAIGNDTGETFCAELTLFNQASSTGYKMLCGMAAKISSSGVTSFSSVIGSRLAQTDVDAIQFFFSSGNASGKYAVYGVL